MIHELLGMIPVVVDLAGAAAGTTVDMQPSAGEQWIVAWAQGEHDDNGAARVIGFQLHDGTNSANIGPGVSVTNGVTIPLYQTNPNGAAGNAGNDWKLPLILNSTMHLTLVGVAIGAGKKLYIHALVYKVRGVGPWSNT